MAEMTNKLNATEDTLSQISGDDNSTDTKLDSLNDDARNLDKMIKELRDQVEFVKNSDVRGKCWFWRGQDVIGIITLQPFCFLKLSLLYTVSFMGLGGCLGTTLMYFV